MEKQTIKVKTSGNRLDTYLVRHFEGAHTRSQIINSIKGGRTTVNGAVVKAGNILKKGDLIDFEIRTTDLPAEPEDIELDIVFEDDHIMVLNKPRGMVVHPGAGIRSGTLLNALLFKMQSYKSNSLPERAGLVHRLDKNTAGLILVAKTAKSQEILGKMFEAHNVKRTYFGLLEGKLEGSGIIDKHIMRDPKYRTRYTTTDNPRAGRRAITHYQGLGNYKYGGIPVSFVRFNLETGRTHQIRVHAKSIGRPLIGDPEYNHKSTIKFNGQLLESVELEFLHPITNKVMNFSVQPSIEFMQIKNKLTSI
ncbi:MAG: RluA family pseudouridine synthase [Firmicutes bacterium]|nr:RluA family pseudouridine synthase [Bacillota bacterium]